MTKKQTKKKSVYSLDKEIIQLLTDEPFFTAFSRCVDKTASTDIPTAAVRINPKIAQFEMLFNPEWMASLSKKQRTAVVKHEFYHIIFEHLTTRKPKTPKHWKGTEQQWMMYCNYAADAAINSYLPDLPPFCIFPGKAPFEGAKSEQSFEYYLNYLLRNHPPQENQQGSGKGDPLDGEGQFDTHDWNEEDADKLSPEAQQAKEIAKQRLREHMKKAVNESTKQGSSGWGTVSADLQKRILEFITPQVDWRAVLRYFIKTSKKADTRSTPKRINRRYRYIHAGKKTNRTANIAISIDQSGSVSDEMLVKFFSELNKLSELATFTVVPFDTKVNEKLVYEWKKGQRIKAERVMCGGTCFNAPTQYVNEHGFDGHIVLTDMEAPAPGPSLCQRMWMTTEDHTSRPYFQTNERVIAIK